MNKNRPTQSFRVDLATAQALVDMAEKRGISRSMILEEIIVAKVGLPGETVRDAPFKDVHDIQKKAVSKKEAPPVPAPWMDWYPTFGDLFGSPKRKGPVGHAVDKALELAINDPAKLVKDATATARKLKLLVGLATLGAAFYPIVKARIDAAKEAKVGGAPATGTAPKVVAITGEPLQPGREPFTSEALFPELKPGI